MAKDASGINLFDPVEIEIEHLEQMQVSNISLEFNDPLTTRFLVHQLIVRLHELRKTKNEVDQLRTSYNEIRNSVEKLRVVNGVLVERERFTWLEFPAGVLCGIAGNLLTADIHNFLAWGILVLGLFFFMIIRIPKPVKGKKKGK